MSSRRRSSSARPSPWGNARWLVAAVALGITLAGCSGTPVDPVQAAQANVAAKQKAVAEAEAKATAARQAFCTAGSGYLTALDGYGDVLVESAPTVGDVRNAGADLRQPRDEVLAAADEVQGSTDQLATAERELVEAEAALEVAKASAEGRTPSPQPGTASATPSATTPPASVARVRQAETDFATAEAGITDETPLREAAEEFNAAVVALEMAWLGLFSDAGCLTDDQQAQAADAVRDYTLALQGLLAEVGLYSGEVDGVYGPQTVAAVKALQEAHGLPQTGVMDRATEAALRAELVAKGGAEAADAIASTAVLQQILKAAGYWDGEVDGIWTDELTGAVKQLQDDLGVPVTGEVDAATVAALREAVSKAGEAAPTPSPTPTPQESPQSSPSPTATG